VLANQRAYLLSALRDLLIMREGLDDELVVGLLITAARLHVEADLAFVDEVETEVLRSGAAGAAGAAVVPPGQAAGSGQDDSAAG
jgi:hypothetical protein